jgi:hypothetical protein
VPFDAAGGLRGWRDFDQIDARAVACWASNEGPFADFRRWDQMRKPPAKYYIGR